MEPRAEIRRRTRLSPEARRSQLMECAIEVFSRRGIGRAGHAEIAEEAKVSVATVFNYFNTREELVDEVLGEVEAFIRQLMTEAYADHHPICDSIRRHVELFVNVAYERPDHANIWLEWSSSVRDEVWPRYVKLLDEILEHITPRLQKALDRGEIESELSALALARILTSFGYLMMQMVNAPERPLRSEVVETVYQYVTAPLKQGAAQALALA
ncbi:TetR/AcrR family transcriptional regulator [Aeromonas schubertii]|uniref:TetR/AcrR family transcriptional regulator n=1 Tax=Aeromonas schubertii TaxID=652 RepID=UPI0010A91245|nr:TetR/AcrR family transcriptional regulator [Aeromonas schubertii]QCG50094.1 TetR/AcrR family transcriptional regulator [Aeromonas schubertii]